MRLGTKSLAVAITLAGVLVSGCSSTTTSSGAVQDDVESATASASLSSPEASEPEPSTSTMPALTATSTPQAEPQYTDVCDTGLQYACGDTGPGGGTVFYASATAFACGADLASMCNYLEAAPNLWNPNSQSKCPGTPCGGSVQTTSDFSGTGKGITYCTGSGEKSSITGAMGSAVGTGYANTMATLAVCNSYDAGPVANAYTGGGLTDWSLPSDQELFALYQYPDRAAIGGFNSGGYWSSTGVTQKCADLDAPAASANIYVSMGGSTGGETICATKGKAKGVRPVRAF